MCSSVSPSRLVHSASHDRQTGLMRSARVSPRRRRDRSGKRASRLARSSASTASSAAAATSSSLAMSLAPSPSAAPSPADDAADAAAADAAAEDAIGPPPTSLAPASELAFSIFERARARVVRGCCSMIGASASLRSRGVRRPLLAVRRSRSTAHATRSARCSARWPGSRDLAQHPVVRSRRDGCLRALR